jgi:tetratricopeptide (TPR) repeat protein
MPFSILAIRSSDDTDGAVWPVLANEPGGIMVEPEALDGNNLGTVQVTAVTLAADGKRLIRLDGINAELYVTDSRVVFACQNFDKGSRYIGTGLGAGVALAATGISKAAAARRQRGKILAGQLRYQWCKYVGATAKRGYLGSDLYLGFVTRGSEGLQEYQLIVKLGPAAPSALDVATDIIRRAARHTLAYWPPEDVSQRETFERLAASEPLADPGKNNMVSRGVPRYYPVGARTAYPRQQPGPDRATSGTQPAGAGSEYTQAQRLVEQRGQLGDLAALASAADLARHGAQTADGPSRQAAYLSLLGTALVERFKFTDDLAALAEAVEASQRAVDVSPPDDPELPGRLSNLGNALLVKGARLDDVAALRQAVAALQRAVDSAGGADAGLYLSNLTGALTAVFERTDDMDALRAAAEAGRKAVGGDAKNERQRAVFLDNLGGTLMTMHECGMEEDHQDLLAELERVSREACDLTDDTDRKKPSRLSHLGLALWAQFRSDGDAAKLAEAVEVSRRAVTLGDKSDPARSEYLLNLSAVLQDLGSRTGAVAALADGIEAGRAALEAVPETDPDRPRFLCGLGIGLVELFDLTGERSVLVEAEDLCRRAVELTPADNPRRAAYLANHALALQALAQS